MNRKEVWDLVRRLRLRLVVDNSRTSDNHKGSVVRKERNINVLHANRDLKDILCQPLETIPNNSKDLPGADTMDKRLAAGVAIAQPTRMQPKPKQQELDFISNAGTLNTPDDQDIPTGYELEIFRLRRRVDELECIVRDKNRRVVAAIGMLEDEVVMYRTLLHDHIAETHDGVQRRMIRIESTLDTLKEKGSKFYPPLPIPKRWQKP